MNFQIAKGGHSFKGAFAYYLHDKQESGPRLATADRVAWTECLNLAHDDPAYAQSVMIATARNAEALKAAAGVAKTGRKATAGPVHAYSIAWHPDGELNAKYPGWENLAEATAKQLREDMLGGKPEWYRQACLDLGPVVNSRTRDRGVSFGPVSR